MADVGTPSAVEMAAVGAGADGKPASTKPERPDEAEFKKELEKRRKALDGANAQVKAKSEALNGARPKNDSVNEKRTELRAQLDAIKQKQSASKASRTQTADRVKTLDTQLKARLNELKAAKAGIPYKSPEEIDQAIARLDKEIEGGKMKVVDEKKALAEISAMRKQKKAFAGLEEKQKEVGKLRDQIAEVKGTSDKSANKDEQDEFTRITAELDKLKAQQDDKYKDFNSHRDALSAAKKQQEAVYQDLKKFQNEYYNKRNAYRDYEREAARVRDEKRKAEREAYNKEKRQHQLNQRLEDARIDAYIDEIRASNALLRLLDPSAAIASSAKEPGKLAAVAQRTVNDSGFAGMKVAKREEDDYIAATGGKKGKKGRKDGTASPAPVQPKGDMGKFWSPGPLEQFKLVGIEPPSSSEEVTSVLQQVKEKRDFWVKDQKRKTQENVETAEKAFEAEVEAESNGDKKTATNGAASSKAATANGDAATAQATEKLAEASVNDKEDEEKEE